MAKADVSGYGNIIGGRAWVRVHGPNLKDTTVQEASNKARLTDPQFMQACEVAGVTVTKRQAAKWNNGKGKAYKMFKHIPMTGIDET